MGYRSQVVLAVSKEARPYLMHFLGKEPEAMSLCFGQHADRVEDFQGEEGAVMFRFDSIKWYGGYNEIDAIEAFMSHMDSDEAEELGEGCEHYRFVRTGEEYDDIVTRGMAFEVYPSVSIDY